MRKKLLKDMFCVVLSIALVLTSTQLWNLVLVASNAIPSFDDEKHSKVLDVSSVLFTENKVTYPLADIKDKSKATFSETTIVRNDNNILNTTPVIILAETDSNLTDATRGNFKNSYIVMWAAVSGGYAIGLLNSDTNGPAVFPNSFLKFANQQSLTGFPGYSGQYPNGGYAIPNNLKVTAKVEGGKLSVWVTSDGNTKEVLREYSSSDYNITGSAAGFLMSQKISNNYNYSALVWTEKNNVNNGIADKPQFDSDTQVIAQEIKKSTFTETKTVYPLTNIIDKSKITFTEQVIQRDDNNVLNTTPIVLLAETDSDITHDTRGNFKNSHIVLWAAATGGYSVALLNSDCTGPAVWIDSFNEFAGQPSVTGFEGWGGVYPNGGQILPNTLTVTTKFENGKISVWLTDGDNTIQILANYKSDKFNITGAAIGQLTSQKISNNYSYTAKAWTAKDNYSEGLPIFDKNIHTDILDMTGIASADWVGFEYNETTGGKMWTDLISGGNSSLRTIDSTLTYKADNIYGSGSIKYKTSGYLPNQAYHYAYIAIAKISEGSKVGYLALKFAAGGQSVKLSFITPAGESTAEHAVLSTFGSVNTSIGTTHSFAYRINTENHLLSIWLNGIAVLTDFVIDSKYTVEDLAVGSGRFYASFQLDNYRVWRSDPVPEIIIPVPEFNPETDVNLAPYAQAAASNVSGVLKDEMFILSQTQNIIGSAFFRKVNLEGDGTMYYHAVINNDIKNHSSDGVYDGPSIALGSVTYDENGKSGYLVLRFTAQDGIDFRITARNGTDAVYLGAITSMKFKYPDTDSAVRNDDTNYVLDVKMSRKSISVWVNEKCIVNDVKFNSFGADTTKKVTVNDFMPGLICVNYTGTVSDFWFWCSKEDAPELNSSAAAEKPVFNKETQTNVTSKMLAVIAGKDGEFKLEKNGTLSIKSNNVGEGEGTDNGAYFSAGIKRIGTMYMRTVIKPERTLDETIATTAIYGGPAIRLANATASVDDSGDQHGFLDILFTERDGIDVRIRDQFGSDVKYMGAISIGLKVAYPDTNTFIRGTGEYEVVAKLSMTRLSLWVNGVCVINDYKLHNILNFDNNDYRIDILDFAPGILFNGETGTVEETSVWCAKEDVKPTRDTEYSYPTAS